MKKNLLWILLVIAILLYINRNSGCESISSCSGSVSGGTIADGTADQAWHGGEESFATMGYGGVGPNST